MGKVANANYYIVLSDSYFTLSGFKKSILKYLSQYFLHA
jgi:hypothetical protein